MKILFSKVKDLDHLNMVIDMMSLDRYYPIRFETSVSNRVGINNTTYIISVEDRDYDIDQLCDYAEIIEAACGCEYVGVEYI